MVILHQGAFINEIIDILKTKKKKEIVVDGTCGTGSHTLALLENFHNEIKKFYCVDIDGEILSIAKERIEKLKNQWKNNIPDIYFVHDNYKNLKNILRAYNRADIIILDLGVSQYHLKTKERGFGFDSPFVDMRYDRRLSQTASDVITTCSKEELENILTRYAGIKKPSKLVDILKNYIKSNIQYTMPLGEYLQQKLGKVRGRLHPATLIFLALRMYVNKELENLEAFLETVPQVLNYEGLLLVITYHSIEDKIVKNYFKNYAKSEEFSLFNKKVIKPSSFEIMQNKSIRSAKLRILYRHEKAK